VMWRRERRHPERVDRGPRREGTDARILRVDLGYDEREGETTNLGEAPHPL